MVYIYMYMLLYANIGGILMGSMLPYVEYMDPMGNGLNLTLSRWVSNMFMGSRIQWAG